jgi:hypothetical protein
VIDASAFQQLTIESPETWNTTGARRFGVQSGRVSVNHRF